MDNHFMQQRPSPPPDDLIDSVIAEGAPPWYLQAVSHPTTSRRVNIGHGLLLMNCVFWNESDEGKPPLLLVHGYRANARAWHAIAPFLTPSFRVIAVDLMGMGESDSLDTYGAPADFAENVAAAIQELQLTPVTLVGHSFGGAISVHLSHRHPELVSRLVIIDTTLLFPEFDKERLGQSVARQRPFPDRASIIARYRLLPDQPCPTWTLAYLARWSVRHLADGWYWQFDPMLPAPQITFETARALRDCDVPVDYIYGGHSRNAYPRRLQAIEDAIGPGGKVFAVPEAHHHVMLDQPQALLQTLRGILVSAPEHPAELPGRSGRTRRG